MSLTGTEQSTQVESLQVTRRKSAILGISLQCFEVETEGEVDPRGFLGIDPRVANDYEKLRYTVRIKGSGTRQQFTEIHNAGQASALIPC